MPRRILAILLMLSLSYQCFVKLGIVIWYECNKTYVANNLCENRAHPERKCCGKCYLRKQLKKADEGAGSSGSAVPEKWNLGEVAVYVVPQTSFSIPVHETIIKDVLPLRNERYSAQNPLSDIFHPPLGVI